MKFSLAQVREGKIEVRGVGLRPQCHRTLVVLDAVFCLTALEFNGSQQKIGVCKGRVCLYCLPNLFECATRDCLAAGGPAVSDWTDTSWNEASKIASSRNFEVPATNRFRCRPKSSAFEGVPPTMAPSLTADITLRLLYRPGKESRISVLIRLVFPPALCSHLRFRKTEAKKFQPGSYRQMLEQARGDNYPHPPSRFSFCLTTS